MPPSYRRISHGDEVSIGTRRFKVITGGGHALDQVMLYCAADKLFLSADQVLSKISPNVSVWAVEPDQNSLGEYLASLASLTTTLPYDVLVLPGHGVPFYGLKTRIKQLADHHEDRCRLIAEACREVPQTSKELVPVVFHKHVLDVHQMGFAAGELIAHVNYMLVEGRLISEADRRRAALPDDLTLWSAIRRSAGGVQFDLVDWVRARLKRPQRRPPWGPASLRTRPPGSLAGSGRS